MNDELKAKGFSSSFIVPSSSFQAARTALTTVPRGG
jgi:hypothetical protein